jgi:hypothetical protein
VTILQKRLAFMLVMVATLAAEPWAQELTPKANPNAQKVQWHKYINKEFGFSLMYPDSYQPIVDAESCKDNKFRRWLLCLARQDDPNTAITVTIVIGAPYAIKMNSGGNEYSAQKIGQHLFYCGVGGSMGTGFSDECTFDLRGKILEFDFAPAVTMNSGVEINPLMFKSLKSFRTF